MSDTTAPPFQITERDYDHKVIKRIVEVNVDGQIIAGAWKQPMSSSWSINIVNSVAERFDLPSDYLHFRIDVDGENEARRVLQILGFMHAAANR